MPREISLKNHRVTSPLNLDVSLLLVLYYVTSHFQADLTSKVGSNNRRGEFNFNLSFIL